LDGHLAGNFHVRVFRPAFADVNSLFNRTRDKVEVRRHALKLRYWPESLTTEPSGQVADLDWSWIRGLDNQKVGELRIHDTIGGNDNLRIIFYVGPACDRLPLRCIWVLGVLQKKRQDFTTNQLRIFRVRRLLVRQRFYDDCE
jgi:hypothetical protein